MIEIRSLRVEETLEIRHQVLWPDKSLEFVKVGEDAEGVHFGLFYEGILVSVISLFPDGPNIRFRKFATIASFQNKGLGSKLLQHAINYAKENQFERMWCDARSSALPFYSRFGFQKFSDAFFKGDIEYYKIEIML